MQLNGAVIVPALSVVCGCSSSVQTRSLPPGSPRIPASSAATSLVSASSTPTPSSGAVSGRPVLSAPMFFADFAIRPVGPIYKEIQLRNIPADGTNRRTFVGFHPSSDPIEVEVIGMPPGGVIPARSGDSEGIVNGTCTELDASKQVAAPIRGADGATHVSMVFRGTWPNIVVVKRFDVFYVAVDNHALVGEGRRSSKPNNEDEQRQNPVPRALAENVGPVAVHQVEWFHDRAFFCCRASALNFINTSAGERFIGNVPTHNTGQNQG